MSSESIRFGAPIPQVFLNGRTDMSEVRDVILAAERLGYDSLWTQDQVIGDVPILECMSILSYAAALTERLSLGVSVIVFPIRNAVQLARSMNSLDQMSHGRAILGIGLGPPTSADDFYRAFGVQSSDRLARFTEGLEIMKALWSGEPVHYEGRFYQLEGTIMLPRPVHQPHPPVWFGGQHPDALRRAVRLGDGYMSAGPTTRVQYRDNMRLIRRFMDEEGRDPATFPLSRRVYLAVDPDAKRAKDRLDDFFQSRYPWQIKGNPDFVADICVWGSPAQCVEGLQEFIDEGAGMLLLNPIWDFVEQLECLAEEVTPYLR